MKSSKQTPEMTEEERIEYLKDLIQRNYDNDNWYGHNESRSKSTKEAKAELESYGVIFNPKYNCPS